MALLPLLVATAASASPLGDLGRFDMQVDGIGACRGVAYLDPEEGRAPQPLLVEEDGTLVGASPDAPSGIRDVAVVDGTIVVAGDRGVHVGDGLGGPWRLLAEMPSIAVDVLADPPIVVVLGAPGTSHAGTVAAYDLGSGSIRWSRARAYPGAMGVAVLPDGRTWIADTDRHRIVQLEVDGEERRAIGDRGAFPGLFNTPFDVVVHDEALYVADHLNHRVTTHRAEDGAFLSQWGMHAVVPREGEGRIHYPERLAIARDGESMLVLEPFERRYQVFGRLAEGESASGTGLPQRRGIESHFGPDVAADGAWLAMWEPETGSIVVFDTRHGIPIHVTTFSEGGRPPAGIGRMAAIAVDGERGDVWLVDAGHRRVSRWMLRPERPGEAVLDPFMGRLARGWGYAAIEEQLDDGSREAWIEPVDAVFAGDRLHLLDAVGPSIVVLDRTLGVERTVSLPDGIRPTQLAVTTDGDAGWIVSEADAGRVWRIGGEGQAFPHEIPGVDRPFGVLGLPDGFAVSDRISDRVVILDRELQPVASGGETGLWDGALWRPAGLAALPDGSVAVVDQGNHRAQGFDPRSGEWAVTFSLGQGHDRPMLLREDFESSDDPEVEEAADDSASGKESE